MDFLKNIFGINEEAQPVDAIRSGKELRERQENLETSTSGITEELKNQNPSLFNDIMSFSTSPIIANKFSLGDALTLRGALSGNPLSMLGLGVMALQNLPKDSFTDKVGIASFGEDYDPYGYKSDLSAGNLGGRQDPFGRNFSSLFDNYEKNRIEEVARLSALENLNKIQKAKLDFGKDYLDQLEAKRQAAINKSFENAPPGSKGNKGADFTGGRYDGAGSKGAYDANPTGFSGSS